MNFNSGKLEDEILKSYIDQVFEKYDGDRNGVLDEDEMVHFFNDLFRSLGVQTNVTRQQSIQAIKSIDQNYDGVIDKKELFDAFRSLMNEQKKQISNQYQSGFGNNYNKSGYEYHSSQGVGYHHAYGNNINIRWSSYQPDPYMQPYISNSNSPQLNSSRNNMINNSEYINYMCSAKKTYGGGWAKRRK